MSMLANAALSVLKKTKKLLFREEETPYPQGAIGCRQEYEKDYLYGLFKREKT